MRPRENASEPPREQQETGIWAVCPYECGHRVDGRRIGADWAELAITAHVRLAHRQVPNS
ncbi:hypothetical protein EV193_10645 [Herbihabitans rhizosphaerae]|uniref:Uncharacterized protein n=1 Tax=Herbihabitans rhizosphaerae TaxID=1872711 RepID=A0A4Q7KMJ7_9PSEU|nr:hypothetical protein EV193_10645 [Herbihabitans rhizosphaerae]